MSSASFHRVPVATILLMAAMLVTAGCGSDPPPPVVDLHPPRTPDPTTREVLGGGTYTPPAAYEGGRIPETPGSDPTDPRVVANSAGRADPGYALDGMVGQVNGKAIYAHNVLEPLDAQLAALGRQLSPREFQRQAMELIGLRLQQLVTDNLIYAEAQRDLTETELLGLQQMMKVQREELLRLYGQGSVALAEQTLREQGTSLDQRLEEFRQGVVVSKLLRDKLTPLINVTKRDIERYYDENKARYNPPATRTLRVIRVDDPVIAAEISDRLNGGDPFEKLAGSVVNRPSLAARDGLMASVTGDVIFREDELNQAMLALDEGQFTVEPIAAGDEYWFIMLDRLEQPPVLSREMAQIEIERFLADQQFRTLTERYRVELFRKGSYAALDQMGRQLLQIAVNRYSTASAQR